jgi:hypothetical protein
MKSQLYFRLLLRFFLAKSRSGKAWKFQQVSGIACDVEYRICVSHLQVHVQGKTDQVICCENRVMGAILVSTAGSQIPTLPVLLVHPGNSSIMGTS